MKATRLFLTALVAVVFIFAGVYPADRVQADTLPTCGFGNTVPERFQNHVNFSATWVNGSPTGAYPFDFGDKSPEYVLTGSDGGELFDHDYPIVIGEAVTYYYGFTVYNDAGDRRACNGQVTIDYRPYQVFLPLVSKPELVPSCTIKITEQSVNHVVFGVEWQDAGNGAHTINFGDGASTQQFSGSEGSGSTWHDYSYPGGKFIAEMNLSGGGSCSTQVDINWP